MKFFVGCGIGFISRSGLHFGYQYTYNPQPGQKKANFVADNNDSDSDSFTREKEKIFQHGHRNVIVVVLSSSPYSNKELTFEVGAN